MAIRSKSRMLSPDAASSISIAIALLVGCLAFDQASAGMVGNNLSSRTGAGDDATTVFYSNFVGMPIDGTVNSVSIWNQGKAGSFQFYHLRPQNGGTAFQILDRVSPVSGFTPNAALSGTVETFGLPDVSVQAGDWFAHYGNGIPFSYDNQSNAENPQRIYLWNQTTVDNAVGNNTVINIDGSTPGYGISSHNRDYAWAVNLVEYVAPVTTDITPTYVHDASYQNYGRIVSSNGSSVSNFDDERWNYDKDFNQQYMWFDLGDALLAGFPSSARLLEAKLTWTGSVSSQLVGEDTVEGPIGLFAAPDDNLGADSILADSPSTGVIPAYYHSHLADLVDSVTATPGVSLEAEWDITAMVQAWLDNPSDPLFGQFVLLQGATPMAVHWAAPGPTFLITTIVPEPASIGILLLGSVALLLRRRRDLSP